MNFELTDEQRAVRDMAQDFAERRVKPIASELDHESRFPKEIMEEMASLKLLGVCIPEDLGGAGMDMISYVLALEEVAKVCASTAVIMSVNNSLVCEPIHRFGNDF